VAIETIFVVGAGAGVPYGMPTGLKLRRDIAYCPIDMPQRYEAGRPSKSGLKDQLAAAVRCVPESVSIDSLLNSRSDDLGEIGKFNIASFIATAERNSVYTTLRAPPAEPERTAGNVPRLPLSEDWLGWINARIVELMRAGKGSNVAFVTFNYDRLIEIAAAVMLQQMFPSRWQELFKEYPRVVHVYGKLSGDPLSTIGDLQRAASSPLPPLDPLRMMAGIRLMEERGGNVDSDLLCARELLREAKRIVFLGFGFDPANIEMLGLRGLLKKVTGHRSPRVIGTAHGMTPMEVSRALALLEWSGPSGPGDPPILHSKYCLELLRSDWAHDWFVPPM
jgi:hypothetical protein